MPFGSRTKYLLNSFTPSTSLASNASLKHQPLFHSTRMALEKPGPSQINAIKEMLHDQEVTVCVNCLKEDAITTEQLRSCKLAWCDTCKC